MKTEHVWIAGDGEFMRLEFVLQTFSKSQFGGIFLPDRIVRPKLPRINGVQWLALMDPNKEVSDYPEVSEVEHIVYHRREFLHRHEYVSNQVLIEEVGHNGGENPRRYPEVWVHEWRADLLQQWTPGMRNGYIPGFHFLVTNGDRSDLHAHTERMGWRIRAQFGHVTAEAIRAEAADRGPFQWPSPPEIWCVAVESRPKVPTPDDR